MTKILPFVFLVAVAPAFGQDATVVLQTSFEKPDDLAGWSGNPQIDPQAGRDGKACAVVKCPSSGGVSLEKFIDLPQADPPRARLFRFSFFVKSSDREAGQLSVSLLKQFHDPQRENEWYDYRTPTFLTAAVSSEWSEVRGEGLVGPEVKRIGLYVRAANEVGEGRLWLDDVRVELLDRGLLLQSGKLGNVFTEETGQMDMIVSGPSKLQSGRVVLKDEEGGVRSEIPLQPGQGEVKIPLPSRGYYDIQAEAAYTDGVRVAAGTRSAVVGPMIPDELRLKSPFGLTGYGPLFFAAGARWDRRHYDLNGYKSAREDGYKSDRSVPITGPVVKDPTSIYVFWPQPTWLQDVKDRERGAYDPFHMYPITDREEFTRLVQYVAKQIPQQMEYLEVANEPDCWNGPWEKLVDYHALMGQAVKAVSPKTKIVGPCLCTIKMHEVKRLVDLGLLKHIDALSIHAYVRATPPEKEFIDYIRQLKAYLASIGRKDMEILITEFGWPIPPGDWQKPVDPLTQARYCSRSLILMRAEELNAILWFCLRWADPNSGAYPYGLVDWEWLPRPAYAAYANVTRCLAGTAGPGRVLNLSPTTYLALFAKGNGCVAAAWDMEGAGKAFLPTPRTHLRDMMGRSITDSPGEEVAVSPSPVFAELPDDSLYKAKEHKGVRLIPGCSAPVTFSPVWIPPKLKFQAGRLEAAADAPAGRYTLVGKSPNGGWLLLPVDVIAPLGVIRQKIAWPLAQANPSLEMSLRSNLEKSVQAQVRADLRGLKESSAETTIAPGRTSDVNLPLIGLTPGKRYLGRLEVQAKGRTDVPTLRFPLDVTILPCPKEGIDSPPADFSAWGASGEQSDRPRQPAPEDCSATIQTAYNDRGLNFLVVVRDNVHYQSHVPQMMWQNDSVQLAFDLDAEKPWAANQQGGGFNGHVKVYEYGAALGEAGTMTWRWVSGDSDLPPDVVDKRMMAHVKREGDRTTYKLFFPWETLGLRTAPPAGSTIGFALVVNDSDGPKSGRNNINLFGGIADRKDPAAYGRLFLR